MGRTISGGEDFEYKYAFGVQDSDLVYLAQVSGVGRASLVFRLTGEDFADSVFLEPEDTPLQRFDDPVDVFTTRARELARLAAKGPRALEAATASELGERFNKPFNVEAEALYELSEDEWPALLAWINTYLPATMQLSAEELSEQDPEEDDEDGTVAAAMSRLWGALPLYSCACLAVHILSYAMWTGDGDIVVGDDDPVLSAVLFDGKRVVLEPAVEAHCRSSSSSAAWERKRLSAISARPDTVRISPASGTEDQAERIVAATKQVAAAYSKDFLSTAKRALDNGDIGVALIAALIGLTEVEPSLPEAVEFRAVARAASALSQSPSAVDLVHQLKRLTSEALRDNGLRALLVLRAAGLPAAMATLLDVLFEDGGVTAFEAALVKASDAESAEERLAAALLRGGLAEDNKDWPSAIHWYRRALELPIPPPMRAPTCESLATCLRHAGRKRAALRRYDESLSLDPKRATAHFGRAFVLDLLGRPRAAINAYSRALRLAPRMSMARFNRACEHGLLGRASRAVRDLRRAIAINPRHAQSLEGERYFDPIRDDPEFVALAAASR
ncbi:MAG: tetratricopeptide repeat protein [Polyangiaceae bacterium]